MATKASWSRNGENWAVLIESDNGVVTGLTGQKIDVRRRDGQTRPVTLGSVIESWDSDRKAKYLPVRSTRGPERQADAERTGTTYTVALRVTNAAGEWVEWAMPIDSTDPAVTTETSFNIARAAVQVRDVMANGEMSTSKKAARPARPSASKKPTTRKAAA